MLFVAKRAASAPSQILWSEVRLGEHCFACSDFAFVYYWFFSYAVHSEYCCLRVAHKWGCHESSEGSDVGV